MRRARGCLALTLAALLLPACERPKSASGPGDVLAQPPAASSDPTAVGPVSVTDEAGRVTSLPAPARRVVSLVPSQTEIIAILAGPDVLVARTAWDTDPALARLPSTENALSPSVEWVAALRPDLVVAWPDRDARTLIARLGDLGIPVYAVGVESLADIDATIARLGVLLGETARADSLRAAIRQQLAAVEAAVAGRGRPRVLYAVSLDPPMPATNATWLGELVETAGGHNIFADLEIRWPQVSLEEVVRRRPEVIIRPVEGAVDSDALLADLRSRPGWRELPAVRAGRVYAVDVNLLNRPGASVARAARVLAALIHPGSLPGPAAASPERRP